MLYKCPNIFKQLNIKDLWKLFSKNEQIIIINNYGVGGFGPNIYGIEIAQQTPLSFLDNLFSFFKSSKYYDIQKTIIDFITKNDLTKNESLLNIWFHYNTLIYFYYRPKFANLNNTQKAKETCVEKINFYKKNKQQLLKTLNVTSINDDSYKTLSIILEKEEKFNEAILICKEAIELGMDDNTKTGYEGRILRLEKKALIVKEDTK